jgi:hypothetical protein
MFTQKSDVKNTGGVSYHDAVELRQSVIVWSKLVPGCQEELKACLLCTTHSQCILLSITKKMQRYTIFFIIVKVLQVSGGFSAHHQELKNCTHHIKYMSSLLAATASGRSKQACHIPDAVCTVSSSWWWAGKPPETCRALTIIRNIV